MLLGAKQTPQGRCTQRRAFGAAGRRLLTDPAKAFVEHRAQGERAILPVVHLYTVSYDDLERRADISHIIEAALGPKGVGAIAVANTPGFVSARRKLLPLAHTFALLPEEVRSKYEDPESHYSFGWSHGKEELSPGEPDTKKGSFYANPVVDDQLLNTPSTDAQKALLRQQYPAYLHANIWPHADLPALEPAVKDAGRVICKTGSLLMDACDRFVSAKLGTEPGQLSGILQRSQNHKARLLHYFPATDLDAACDQQQAWCGWHNDHGSLTGLMAAMYIDESGCEVPSPDPNAGLYVRDRLGRVVRVAFPADCIAFQVGEALQVHSGGLLRATAHYVRAAEGPAAVGVSRNTFAVFMQPDVMEPMDCPPGVGTKQVEVGKWRQGQTFGQFAEATFDTYYPKH